MKSFSIAHIRKPLTWLSGKTTLLFISTKIQMSFRFSLFRSDNKEEAELRFINYKDKIPIFIEINKDVSYISENKTIK